MPARINFLAAEAAAKGDAPVRLNQTLVELAAKTTAPARMSNAFAEAAAKGIAPLRVNAAFAESATKGTAPLRLGFVAIECLVKIEVPPTVSTEKFPLSPGLSWSVHVAPKFNTRVAGHVSGREIRTAWQQYAIYDFTLSFDVLRGDATQEIQTLMPIALWWLRPMQPRSKNWKPARWNWRRRSPGSTMRATTLKHPFKPPLSSLETRTNCGLHRIYSTKG